MADDLHSPTSLGASGLMVSKLWLGAMMFGDQTDEAEAARIVAGERPTTSPASPGATSLPASSISRMS